MTWGHLKVVSIALDSTCAGSARNTRNKIELPMKLFCRTCSIDLRFAPERTPMRNSTQLDSLAALEKIARRGVITFSDTPVILSLRFADNDASHEDPAISKDKVEPRAQHSFAANGFGDVATTNTASSAWPMSYELHQAARAHRSYVLGQAI